MTDDAQVSAIMAARDAADTIIGALVALVTQAELLEVLVVDDGSVDRTAEMVSAMGHPKIRLIQLPESVGRSTARNLAAAEAKGTYLAVADADDVSLPGRFARLLELAENSGAVAVGGQVASFETSPEHSFIVHGWPTSEADIRKALTRGSMPFAHPTMLIRRDAFAAVGGYKSAMQWSEDFDLVRRLADQGGLLATDEVVLLYRRPLRDAWSYMFRTNRARLRAHGTGSIAAVVGACAGSTRAWLRVRVKSRLLTRFEIPADVSRLS